MAKRSLASLAVSPIGLPSRLAPPDELTKVEASVWRAVVETKPVDWFKADSAPLLTEYCRAKVMCDVLAKQVSEALQDGDSEVIRRVLDMRDKESKRMTTLAVKMRLTQQARYFPDKAGVHDRKASAGKPWQTGK